MARHESLIARPKRVPHPAEILLRWFLLVAAIIALACWLVGCSTQPPLPMHPEPRPHRQRAAWPFEVRASGTKSTPRATTPQWPSLRVQWLPAARAEPYFVYHATVPSYNAMQFLGATTNTWFDFRAQQIGFLGVKATNQAGVSDWGIPKR